MSQPVTLRVWNGCTVVGVLSLFESSTGMTAAFEVSGGAARSGRVDVEIDPWANVVVDRRVEHPSVFSIRENPDLEDTICVDDSHDEFRREVSALTSKTHLTSREIRNALRKLLGTEMVDQVGYDDTER